MQSSDPQKREAFSVLFPCFRKMVDACPDSNPVNPLGYAKVIPVRIFRQTCSVCGILGRVPVPLFEPETMGDPDSIQVITRSILESYLIFNHLYIAPKTEAEKEFWWFTWVLKSLLSRSEKMNVISENLPVESYDEKTGERSFKSGKEVKKNMLRNADEIREVLKKNEFYKQHIYLPDKKIQKQFEKWVTEGWKSSPTQLIKEAGMKHFTAWNVYGAFSDSAHIDHISMKQLFLTRGNKEQVAFAEASLGILLIVIARVCLELPKVFPEVASIIGNDEKALIHALAYKKVSEAESTSDI